MEELLTPFHLRLLSAEARQRGEVLTLRLVCPCGGGLFRLEEAAMHPEERREFDAYWSANRQMLEKCWAVRSHREPSGRTVLQYRRWPLGRWHTMDVPLPLPSAYRRAVRGTCCACGRIHLIFDSALHGYDAVCGELAAAAEDAWQPPWRELPLPEGTVAVEAELVRDVPEEELRGLSPEECANAFGCIRLCSLDGQRRVLFEHESA